MKMLKDIITESLIEMDIMKSSEIIDSSTELYNGEAGLDSLGLVTLLINIEQKIESEYGISLTIADEKAMSEQNSPFKTIGSLVSFLEKKTTYNE
jgi:acyl carrier protein